MARKEKQFHYLYKITNTKSGKYYIGMHSTNNMEDGYMGGGKRITNSVRKHGKDAHDKEVLEYFDDRESLRQREIEIVNEDLLKDPMCMNLQPGGGGGFGSDEHRRKNLEAFRKGGRDVLKRLWEEDGEWKRNQCEIRSNRWKNNEFASKVLNGFTFRNKRHTQETIEKIRISANNKTGDKNSQYGSCWITNEIESKKIKKGESLPDGWRLGRKMNKNK